MTMAYGRICFRQCPLSESKTCKAPKRLFLPTLHIKDKGIYYMGSSDEVVAIITMQTQNSVTKHNISSNKIKTWHLFRTLTSKWSEKLPCFYLTLSLKKVS
jgi:hypothetical protein